MQKRTEMVGEGTKIIGVLKESEDARRAKKENANVKQKIDDGRRSQTIETRGNRNGTAMIVVAIKNIVEKMIDAETMTIGDTKRIDLEKSAAAQTKLLINCGADLRPMMMLALPK